MSNKFSSSDIVVQFPIKPDKMPQIATSTTTPTYTSILKFQEAINRQALAIPLTGSDLGHLALVIAAGDFTTANGGFAFVAQVSPGLTPVHANGATAAQIAKTNHIFSINTTHFKVYQNIRKGASSRHNRAIEKRAFSIFYDSLGIRKNQTWAAFPNALGL